MMAFTVSIYLACFILLWQDIFGRWLWHWWIYSTRWWQCLELLYVYLGSFLCRLQYFIIFVNRFFFFNCWLVLFSLVQKNKPVKMLTWLVILLPLLLLPGPRTVKIPSKHLIPAVLSLPPSTTLRRPSPGAHRSSLSVSENARVILWHRGDPSSLVYLGCYASEPLDLLIWFYLILRMAVAIAVRVWYNISFVIIFPCHLAWN